LALLPFNAEAYLEIAVKGFSEAGDDGSPGSTENNIEANREINMAETSNWEQPAGIIMEEEVVEGADLSKSDVRAVVTATSWETTGEHQTRDTSSLEQDSGYKDMRSDSKGMPAPFESRSEGLEEQIKDQNSAAVTMLPSFSQVDPEVLEALPLSIRSELAAQMKPSRRESATSADTGSLEGSSSHGGPVPPPKKPLAKPSMGVVKRGRGGGFGSRKMEKRPMPLPLPRPNKNEQARARTFFQEAVETADSYTASASWSGYDTEVLRQLEIEMGSEWVKANVLADRGIQKKPDLLPSHSRQADADGGSSSRMATRQVAEEDWDVDAVDERQTRNHALTLDASDLQELQRAVSGWIRAFSQPQRPHLQLLVAVVRQLLIRDRRMDLARDLLRLLLRKSEEASPAWQSCLWAAVQEGQSLFHDRYGAGLSLLPSTGRDSSEIRD